MTEYSVLIEDIIKKFEETQGEDLAIRQAQKAEGVKVDDEGRAKEINCSGEEAISRIIEKYSEVMGPVAEAIASRAVEEDYVGEKDIPEKVKEKI